MTNPKDKKLELEILLTEHERLLEQYSELFQDQQNQIDRLKMRIGLLEERLTSDDGANDGESGDGHEPPPHY